MAKIQKLFLFSGRVQGVGFRFTTHEIAQRYRVVGWVKNLHDGRVECAVHGTADAISQFELELCHGSRLANFIEGRQVRTISVKQFTDLEDFQIRR